MPIKSLQSMAVPLVISFTLRFLFAFVDMAFAATLDEKSVAVAAIGFYTPLGSVLIAVWVGLSAGFTAALSAAFGHRDEARVVELKRAMLRVLTAAVPALAALGAAVWLAVPYLGLEPQLARAFATYATTVVVGMPLTGFWSIYPDSIVKAHHDTRSTMVAGLMSTAANVVLNALFVFGFGLGLFGIALATVLSRLAGFGYATRRAQALEALRRREPWPPPAPRAWPPPTRLILTLALPGGLTYLLAAVEGSVINAVLTGLPNSTEAIASWGVYERMLSLAIMPAVATSVAVVPYVARLLPTADAHRMRAELGQTLAWVLGAALVLTAAFGWLWAAPLASFFVDSESGGASPLTLGALRMLPFGALALVPFHMLRPVCEAAQRPQLGVLLALARYVALSLPCVLAGRHLAPALGYDGLHGLIAGFVAAAALASAATLAAVHKLAPRAAPPSA